MRIVLKEALTNRYPNAVHEISFFMKSKSPGKTSKKSVICKMIIKLSNVNSILCWSFGSIFLFLDCFIFNCLHNVFKEIVIFLIYDCLC